MSGVDDNRAEGLFAPFSACSVRIAAIVTYGLLIRIGDVRGDRSDPVHSIHGSADPFGGLIIDLPGIVVIVEPGFGETGLQDIGTNE